MAAAAASAAPVALRAVAAAPAAPMVPADGLPRSNSARLNCQQIFIVPSRSYCSVELCSLLSPPLCVREVKSYNSSLTQAD